MTDSINVTLPEQPTAPRPKRLIDRTLGRGWK